MPVALGELAYEQFAGGGIQRRVNRRPSLRHLVTHRTSQDQR